MSWLRSRVFTEIIYHSWRLSLPPHRGSSLGKAAGVTLNCVFFPPDVFPQPDLTDEGLARPVLAGIVATICFLAAAILFSTLAACFVNKQRKRKLKRKKGESIPGVLPPSFLSPPRFSPPGCVVVVTFFPVCLFFVRARPQVKP